MKAASAAAEATASRRMGGQPRRCSTGVTRCLLSRTMTKLLQCEAKSTMRRRFDIRETRSHGFLKPCQRNDAFLTFCFLGLKAERQRNVAISSPPAAASATTQNGGRRQKKSSANAESASANSRGPRTDVVKIGS